MDGGWDGDGDGGSLGEARRKEKGWRKKEGRDVD